MKKNNRILILTGVFPPNIGGPTAQIGALSQELIKNNFKIKVLTYGESNNKKYSYKVKRVSNKNLFKNLIYLINGLLMALNSDIIYSWDLYTAGLTSLIIKKILRKKVVNRFVGDSAWEKAASQKLIGDDNVLIFQDKKYSKKIESWKKRRKKILINSDKIIVVSNFLKKVALKIGVSEKKIKVIYNSVDMINSENQEIYKNKNIILLTIARLVPWKGIDMLIKIMPDLIKKYNKINLVIIGDGPEMDNLKNLVKKYNLKNNIIFTGKLNRDNIIKYFNIADLFLLNTNYEGMSHTILEAMKFGAPVITTKAGGNPETIIHNKTGLLVDYNNQEQWIESIKLLLNNPDLAKKLSNQAKISLEKFNWENLVNNTINIFKNL